MKPIRRTTRVSVRGHCAWKIILPVGRLGKWWITTPKDPGNVVCPFRSWPNFMACFYGGDPNYLRLPGMMILLDRGGLLGRPGLVKISSCKLGPLGFHGFPRKKTLGFGVFFVADSIDPMGWTWWTSPFSPPFGIGISFETFFPSTFYKQT